MATNMISMKKGAPGIAVGPVFVLRKTDAEIKEFAEDTAAEIIAFDKALEKLKTSIEADADKAGTSNRKIILSVLQIANDESYKKTVEKYIKENRNTAAFAVQKAAVELAAELENLSDEYLKARAGDIKGVADRLSEILTCNKKKLPEAPSIILSEELSPADVASLLPNLALGFVAVKGSATAHAAIIAGNNGIPYLFDENLDISSFHDGDTLVIDGDKGGLVLSPDAETIKEAEEASRLFKIRQSEALNAEKPDTHVKIYANIASPADIPMLQKYAADGVGLFRTEFLFMNRNSCPSEEEQFMAYKQVLETMGNREVVIRTMDIGSDKTTECISLEKETNPSLGLRGLRLSLKRKDLFKVQLRALLRAAVFGNVKIMFPMISGLREVLNAKKLVAETAEELNAQNIEYNLPPIGIMIETPAAALISDELAKHVDFFSVGTNDLTQYTLALDRESTGLEEYYEPHSKAVLRLIKMAADNAHRNNITISVCGELAADLEMISDLLDAGIDTLSVSPVKMPSVREAAYKAETTKSKKTDIISEKTVVAPADGILIPMEEIPDKAFSQGVLGKCFGVYPDNGVAYAPVSGVIENIAETLHAITICTEAGEHILIHVGIDTVNLKGKGFEPQVKLGQKVNVDDILTKFDLQTIISAGYSPMVITVLLKA